MSENKTTIQSPQLTAMAIKLSLIDFQIIKLLSERVEILSKLQQKDLDSWPVTNLEELSNILITPQHQFYTQAKKTGLKGDFVRRLYRDILHYSLSLVANRLTNPDIAFIKESTKLQSKKSKKSKKKA